MLVEYTRIREEFVASATWVSVRLLDELPGSVERYGESRDTSTISSLKPMSWRVNDRVDKEWKRMF